LLYTHKRKKEYGILIIVFYLFHFVVGKGSQFKLTSKSKSNTQLKLKNILTLSFIYL
jgi:hypothetical protein